jgi:exodeoxyribonuclease-3/AP endonuclease-1
LAPSVETEEKPALPSRGLSGCIEESQDANATSTTPDDLAAKPAKRAKKAKPEGPYTKYKTEGDGTIPEASLQRREVPETKKSFKVVSWNVGGLRAFLKNRIQDLKELASREAPDVIGMSEHKLQEGDTENSVNELLEALPDYTLTAVNCSTVKKGYSGTMVLMRKGSLVPLHVDTSDLASAAGEGRLITMKFEPLTVVMVYVPNAGDGLKRLDERVGQWDSQLREKLVELAKEKPTMLVGDLNVAHLDADIWNVEAPHVPKSASTTPQERASFGSLLDAGFVDGFRHVHPDALGAFTYWSVRAGNRPKNKGLRLDYAVVSKDMTSVEDSASKPSLIDVFHMVDLAPGDHCAIGAVVAL